MIGTPSAVTIFTLLKLCFDRVCCSPETPSCKLGPRRARLVCHSPGAVAALRTRNRHIAGGWHIVVSRFTLAVHGVFREGSKRVCSADVRRWHWYRSHGAIELSLANSPKVRQSQAQTLTLNAEDLNGFADLSGRHSWSRELL